MRKALIGLALGTAMVATPALARDGSWYAGLGGGLVFSDDLDIDADVNGNGTIDSGEENLVLADSDSGWEIEGVIGRDFGMFRLEAEVANKNSGVDRLVAAPAFGGFDIDFDGDLNVKSLMLNLMADFGPDDGAQLFVGGGAGLAGVDISGEEAGVPGVLIDDADSGFAWQAIAGARFPVSRTVDLGLKYKFFNVDDLNFLTPDDERIETDYRSHSILATLTFNFGAPPPPPPPPPPAPPPPAPPPPAPPPPPQMKTCPDGSRIPVAQTCPVPPPPAVEPSGERG